MGQKIINRKSEQVTNYLHCTLRDIKNRSAFAIGAIELIMENENRSFRDKCLYEPRALIGRGFIDLRR